jgi:hypothetical protein
MLYHRTKREHVNPTREITAQYCDQHTDAPPEGEPDGLQLSAAPEPWDALLLLDAPAAPESILHAVGVVAHH